MVISFLDVKRADRNYEYFYGDLYALMQNAGRSVAEALEESYGKGKRILVLCGSGNNGGDGLVAASILSTGNDVSVCVIKGRESMKTPESRKAASSCRARMIEATAIEDAIRGSDIIVDAIFGSGITGRPRAPYDAIISGMNASGKKIVSVDVPSGLGSGLAVRPDVTATFTDVKEGMTSSNSGKIVVKDIGIPGKVFDHNGPGDFVYYRLPGAQSHKGMNGTVALVSGWTFYGSAVIAARGAVKSGADLVKVFSREPMLGVLSSHSPDIMVRNVQDEAARAEVPSHDAVIIGPGLGKSQDTSFIPQSMAGYSGTIILDAEGLELLQGLKRSSPAASFILTPHRGEFRRMAGKEPDQGNAEEFARNNGCTIVLKGHVDTITDGLRTKFTEGGNARMTMGGTGDLLAGITGSLVSRVDDPFNAACLATFVNKKAAEMAFRQKSYWYDINDMIAMVPEAMKLAIGVARET